MRRLLFYFAEKELAYSQLPSRIGTDHKILFFLPNPLN